ncbi:dihydroorotase [Nitratiruptor sp. SB155-2]|uniref:dihydroorotase n=1 Tax=Nitratiruptor sp. (strain SB155-2) TaxID=387092 RepID=UPI000158702E|nr:dihydroorotase [Nitratiruptor sp. SB155-2]BAF70534.1 dihydroorotase [Nitratiruptor sp. SB155-2]
MQIRLESPLDMHLHLRDGAMLQTVAPLSAKSFSGAIVMPNLVPPITDIEMVQSYKKRIEEAIGEERFEAYMTLFFKPSYSYDFLYQARPYITAIKLYPAGITTNSQDGVDNFSIDALAPTLEAMSELGIPLCVHGETNGFVMDREAEFIPIYEKIARKFPNLKIIMEHITTKEAVDALMQYENLYATITLHHLYITLDDVAGGLLQPHLFCKPIAKRPEDRMALRKVAFMAHPKVMFGSDSAPHPREKKEAPGCAAGVFTAPIALQALAQIFEEAGVLENLQLFVSDNARKIYGITPPKKEVTLEKVPFDVPSSYNDVVPMFAERELSWSITSVQ